MAPRQGVPAGVAQDGRELDASAADSAEGGFNVSTGYARTHIIATCDLASTSIIAAFGVAGLAGRCVERQVVAAPDRDLDSYLDADGGADIFFATDFALLARAYAALGLGDPADVETPKSAAFFRRDPLAARAATRSGYNPLLEDFTNTRVFLAAPRG